MSVLVFSNRFFVFIALTVWGFWDVVMVTPHQGAIFPSVSLKDIFWLRFKFKTPSSKYIIIKYFSEFLWTLHIISWEWNIQSKVRVCFWICSKAKQNDCGLKSYMEHYQIKNVKLPTSCSPFQKHVKGRIR